MMPLFAGGFWLADAAQDQGLCEPCSCNLSFSLHKACFFANAFASVVNSHCRVSLNSGIVVMEKGFLGDFEKLQEYPFFLNLLPMGRRPRRRLHPLCHL
jgi:hypothetical protein